MAGSPLQQVRGRVREGRTWFDTVLTDDNAGHLEVAAAVRGRALADSAVLASVMGAADSMDQAQQALVIAREVDDPALLVRALTTHSLLSGFQLISVRVSEPHVLCTGRR